MNRKTFASTDSATRRGDTRIAAIDLDLSGPVLDGIVLDVGRTGLGIQTNLGVRVGDRYSLSLKDRNGERCFTTTGQVAWCKLAETQRSGSDVVPVFRSGIQLLNPVPHWVCPDTCPTGNDVTGSSGRSLRATNPRIVPLSRRPRRSTRNPAASTMDSVSRLG